MSVLDRNLRALRAAGFVSLAEAVAAAGHRNDEIVVTAKDGATVNGLLRNTRPVLFHSRYSARREAERLAATAGGEDLIVVLGMGMAHHAAMFLARGATALVIEPDLALLRSALDVVDLSHELTKRKLSLSSHTTPHEIAEVVSRQYDPVSHRRLTVSELPGRVAAEPERFDHLRAQVHDALESVRNDLAVQSRFGRCWMRNTVLNAARAKPHPLPRWNGMTVIVAAAGPSLAQVAPRLRVRSGVQLIAVDTALPILMAHGVRPDLALTVDCQLASYHHFLCAGVPDLPVVAELAVTPSVFARGTPPLPVLSHHPLHTLLRVSGLTLPTLDARGGNVTEAALHLAAAAGAQRIVLAGADYSYPDESTYASGSYIHQLFAARSSRLRPAAGQHAAFLFDRPGVARDPSKPGRWIQPLLSRYAEGMEAAVRSIRTPVERLQLGGIPLGIPIAQNLDGLAGGPPADAAAPARAATSPSTPDPHEPDHVSGDPVAVLGRVRGAIAALEALESYRRALGSHETDALPALALRPLLLHHRARDPDVEPRILLQRAVRESLTLLDHVLT